MNVKKGFSLIEMLAAVAVFVLLALMITQLVGGASTAIEASRKAIDADSQARFVFSRMGQDFQHMLKRNDVDMIFSKQTGNDKMFFYSEVQASFDSEVFSGSLVTDPKNPVSLVGYRVAEFDETTSNSNTARTSLQLERLGKGLTWDGSNFSSGGSVVFLTYQSGKALEASTLNGNPLWRSAIGDSPTYNGASSDQELDYHVVGDQVFRMEYCFLLNDGTYSTMPLKKYNNIPVVTNQNRAPQPVDSKQPVGTRWFDSQSGRGYVCQSLTAGNNGTLQAVWKSAGVQDVSAIVVAIAVLDSTSRKMVTNMTQLPSLFEDVTENDLNGGGGGIKPDEAVLMEQVWKEEMSLPGFVKNAQIPAKAAGQIKIYQRYFYLNNPQ